MTEHDDWPPIPKLLGNTQEDARAGGMVCSVALNSVVHSPELHLVTWGRVPNEACHCPGERLKPRDSHYDIKGNGLNTITEEYSAVVENCDSG